MPGRGDIERPAARWVRLFQDSKRALLLRHLRMRGQSYAVLHYLETVSGWDNSIPSTAEVAEAINWRQPNVSRAYRELLDGEFILKRGTRYYLSPLVAWKGTQKAYDAFCRELFADQGPPRLALR